MQRLQLSLTMTNDLFLAQFRQWVAEMRAVLRRAGHGGMCAGYGNAAMVVDSESSAHRQRCGRREAVSQVAAGVTFPLADALCWLLAHGNSFWIFTSWSGKRK